jgi:hypothetical protein
MSKVTFNSFINDVNTQPSDFLVGINAAGTSEIKTTISNLGNTIFLPISSLSANWNSAYSTLCATSGTYINADYVQTHYANLTTNNTFTSTLSVLGNLVVVGTLSAGTISYKSNTTSSSALSVINNAGSAPALYISQGAAYPGPIANFVNDSNTSILYVGNASGLGRGYIGINTRIPTAELTINGAVSANGSITVNGGNSQIWNTTYSTVTANSGSWVNTTSTLATNSGTWNNTTSTLSTNSGSWVTSYSTVNANSGVWGNGGSLTSTVTSNSASWSQAYSYLNTTTATLFNVTSLSATSGVSIIVPLNRSVNASINQLPLTIIGAASGSVFNQIQNTYAGVSASADISIYNDAGSYFDIGINSTQYNGNAYGGLFTVVKANDSYAYNAGGGSFALGTVGYTGDVIIFAGGSLSGAFATGGNEVLRAKGTNGNVGIGTSNPNATLTVAGAISALSSVYVNGIPVGATGNGTDSIFHLNGQTVNNSYAIPVGYNAMTAGPITINSGVTVTIPNGSVWTVV